MEKNEIVINGVHHVLVEDVKMEGDCRDCSLQQLCNELRGDGVCVKMFDRLDSHFEIKEINRETIKVSKA